jgi:error-prone DNA polymerase
VLGARLISVTGKLQNASNVIHVVADEIEDLTPLLRRLSDDGVLVDAAASPGEAMPKGRNFH